MLTNDGLKNAELGLDFESAWFRYDGHTAPLLRSFLKPLTIDGISRRIDKVYDGLALDFKPDFLYSSPDAASSNRLHSTTDANASGKGPDVGSYTSSFATTFWSDQQGYLIKNPLVNQNATAAIGARPIIVQASSDTKLFDDTVDSAARPSVSPVRNGLNLGLANGDVLNAVQSFDSKDVGDRTLIVSALEIKNGAGKSVESNYQVTRTDASGKIAGRTPEPGPVPTPDPNPGPTPKPDPNPDPTPKPGPKPEPFPNPVPQPGPAVDPKPPADHSGGNGQGGSGGDPGTQQPGINPADAGDGWSGGGISPPAGSAGDQQRTATISAFLGAHDEDELMKRRSRNERLKNDVSLSIRNGGIYVPGENFSR
jgi:hypothetical protein